MCCVNKWVVVPRALAAGRASFKERYGKDADATKATFVSEGGAASTKTLHRTVVVFVTLMLVGIVPHAVSIVEGSV
eukprot:CAMPEP_0175812998 /NCGR_PEP_ID=MMETSP0107_2-20121207/4672_1 /TAXON_ID=195067 ORGANISM="Goniomonas pacifica, Strain CCMP1869" /NCGR_SAMPLE_ID=MMETSP0107_2 /ASSEMBLY_ACC=CAM_ASM_000203 /LENGTH=75 /DNA_ID=CAMNT_0017124891 /DNA_START=243 /DNA_END=470 /DNA_ORIENTATION=-